MRYIMKHKTGGSSPRFIEKLAIVAENNIEAIWVKMARK